MQSLEYFSSMETWFFAIIAALAVLGLAKAWTNFKAKYAERVGAKEEKK